jgi:hypothetical protein
MAEKDPAKQTPDGQKTRPGTTPSSKQKTADSSTGKKSSSTGSSKASVQVSLDKVQADVLDNLREASSRHEYLQAVVTAHLNAANPNAVFVEDDDLPGNERQLKNPVARI